MSVRIEPQAEPLPGYKLLDRLGAGGFGEVWKCEAPGGIFKAVKFIFGDLRSQDSDLIRYAEQELKALKRVKQVRHPYLLALDRYDIVDGRLMIVMELADCNLWDRFRQCRDKGLPGIPRDELLMYMAEAAEVLDLMNDVHQLQHLDIKPQNLFMLHNHVKVADFGQVKDLQGVMASVTGGITPVYAAPETFDGVVSRFCDQYSLACVYQELLTGQRPFDGCSLSQLLMQHLQLPPDLKPSPACDRPALERALAKKPEDRWPNVASFIRALREAGDLTGGRASASGGTPRFAAERPVPAEPGPDSTPLRGGVDGLSLETPFPRGMSETDSHQPVFTPAPPEVSGDGPLRPALVVGVGLSGLRVLQKFRYELAERYGPPEATPLVRTVFIDTDPETLEEAKKARPYERLAGLSPDDLCPAKLNRAGHYLKPRLNGRSLIEGWFDAQLLYRIPRNPQTMGLRLFGRLAFCDHYRPILGKIHAELDACLSPDALHRTEERTGLRRRTNRPRVYVVGGVGGGTGGGMFLDIAYATRVRLRRMGYENPEIIGVLVVPPADPAAAPPLAVGNTYAALAELNHFSRPETVFTANYDDRNGVVREKDPPFTRCYLLPAADAGFAPAAAPGSGVVASPRPTPSGSHPGSRVRPPGSASGVVQKPGSREMPNLAALQQKSGSREMPNLASLQQKPGSREMPNLATLQQQQRRPDPARLAALQPFADAAELIRLDLFTPVGRTADELRTARLAGAPAAGVRVGAFGLAAFDWPRAEVLTRTTAAVARMVLKTWITPNVKRAREVVPGWAAGRWAEFGLEPEALFAHLQAAAEDALGGKVEEQITLTTEPLVPRGWLARLPDPAKVAVAVDRVVKMFGPPASPAKREPTPAEAAVAAAARLVAEGLAAGLRALGEGLVDDPQFRLSGADEVLRQFLAITDRLLDTHLRAGTDADARARAGYECLMTYAHFRKGVRRPAAPEFTDALRQFPRARFQAVVSRQLAHVYQAVRGVLATNLGEVLEARKRVEEAAAGPEPPDPIPGPRRLMPPGCFGVGDAVQQFLGVLTDADLAEIDRRVQAALDAEYGGLFQAGFHSKSGPDGVTRVLREQTRAYLDERLGEVDLGAMFVERFRSRQLAEQAVGLAFAEAGPDWVGHGPWAAAEVVVAAAPGGPTGQPVRELVSRAVPVAGLTIADSRDDVTLYREYPAVPLSVVPHLGPAGAAAYQHLPDTHQCSLHARLDVTLWTDVDKD